MPNAPRNNTAYAEYVKTNIMRTVADRVGAYNYKELAEMVGLKPTHNFRRRIGQLVAEGYLVCVATFTPRGGIENRFTTPTTYETTEIPF